MRIAQQKHHIPGRLRLRIASGTGDQALLESFRERLTRVPGVHTVQVKPSTAVIIVEYDPTLFGTFRDRLAEFARNDDLFLLAPVVAGLPAPHPSALKRTVEDGSSLVDRIVRAGTGNLVSLKEAVPLAILTWAIIFVDPATAAHNGSVGSHSPGISTSIRTKTNPSRSSVSN